MPRQVVLLALFALSASCPVESFRADDTSMFVFDSSLPLADKSFVYASTASSSEIPIWSPLPLPAGVYLQAADEASLGALFNSINVRELIPASRTASGVFSFLYPDDIGSVKDIIEVLVGRRVLPKCRQIISGSIWGGRVSVVGRGCVISEGCGPTKELVHSASCCTSAEEVRVGNRISGTGAHRKLHGNLKSNWAAVEWLPREVFADPDDIGVNAMTLTKVDIEAPSYVSGGGVVIVREYPLLIHSRYVRPENNGGYKKVNIHPPVLIGKSGCAVEKNNVWSKMDKPYFVISFKDWHPMCVLGALPIEEITIPKGDLQDLKLVMPVAGFSAIFGLLLIVIAVWKH